MTSIGGEEQTREPDAQAASHDAPVPNEEAATADATNADQERQQAAKRERADFLAGIRKLMKSFKSLSHIFEIYKEEDDNDEEDMDTSIEIGFPTDVQHVAHIGLDGSTNVSSLRGLEGAGELLSLSNLTTLEQFELAMVSLVAPSKEHNRVLYRVSPST